MRVDRRRAAAHRDCGGVYRGGRVGGGARKVRGGDEERGHQGGGGARGRGVEKGGAVTSEIEKSGVERRERRRGKRECERPVSGASLQEKSACGGGEFSTVELANFLDKVHLSRRTPPYRIGICSPGTGVTAQSPLTQLHSHRPRSLHAMTPHMCMWWFMHLALLWRFTDSVFQRLRQIP